MANELVLSHEEQQTVSNVQSYGSSAINNDNLDMFASALLKTSAETYKKLIAVIAADTKLQKDISTQLAKSAQEALSSNDKSVQIALENTKANSESIRKLMESGNLSMDQLSSCLDDLRNYAQEMFRLAQKYRHLMTELCIVNK